MTRTGPFHTQNSKPLIVEILDQLNLVTNIGLYKVVTFVIRTFTNCKKFYFVNFKTSLSLRLSNLEPLEHTTLNEHKFSSFILFPTLKINFIQKQVTLSLGLGLNNSYLKSTYLKLKSTNFHNTISANFDF